MAAKINFEEIKSTAPTAWKDFNDFYSDHFKRLSVLSELEFVNLPFELQLGVLLRYFNENAVEVDICNNSFENLPQTFTDTFRSYEKIIAHYS